VSDARRAFTYLVESAALMSPIPAVTPVIRTPTSNAPLFRKAIPAKQIADTIVREPRIVVFMGTRLHLYDLLVKRFLFPQDVVQRDQPDEQADKQRSRA
jgi:hypothetical protein